MTGVQTCALPICFPVTIEYATIYGLDGKTLRIGDYYITENAFRKAYAKNPRISHDSLNIYVHNIRGTHANESHFSKQSFTKI